LRELMLEEFSGRRRRQRIATADLPWTMSTARVATYCTTSKVLF